MSQAGSKISFDVRRPTKTSDLVRATSSAWGSKKLSGTLSVFAEVLNPQTGNIFIFTLSSALLRDTGAIGRRVTQYYEIQRQAPDDNDTWSCVYRSEDGLCVDSKQYVVFDEISITEQQLHNMNPKRPLRIAIYKRHTRKPHELISYVTTSMFNIMEAGNRTREVEINMEGEYSDDDALGKMFITCEEKVTQSVSETVDSSFSSGSSETIAVNMRADHFLHRRFVSSLSESIRGGRRLRQLPSFITLH